MSRVFIAEMRETGQTVATSEHRTWNAAVRGSEALVRDFANRNHITLSASAPEVYGPVAQPGSTYRRIWSGSGVVVRVEVAEVAS